ncbi:MULTISPECIES: TetR/AcrR family transcriptional regulator C-terminal domain-containing protein [unclassified Brachybacterium]|uniref:TetR/AcrR family transcriptional regulator C-terminal domain-containing protein n=1 Tax=unclassified Brachybacterium TaxID=2623841 RepID=UPI00360AD1C8
MDSRRSTQRAALTPERIVAAALELADADGIAGVSMRAVAGRLGVQAMSLYNHIPGREALLDHMVDAVFSEISPPDPAAGWRAAMEQRACSARAVLARHHWAVGLLDSRSRPGPATLEYHEATLRSLRTHGFSVPATAHAVAALDAYIYGFVLQEVSLPFSSPDELEAVAEALLDEETARRYPFFTEFARTHALQQGYDFGAEFEHGLTMLLDSLAPDRPDVPTS